MKNDERLNEINDKLKQYKTESEIRSDFINNRMKNDYRLKSLNYRALNDYNVLDYQLYSFIKLVICIEDLSSTTDANIRYLFAEMWLNHNLFFKKKRWEAAIFAITWYCTLKEYDPIDVSRLVKVFFKPEDQPEMLLQVFACETRILDYYDNDIDLGIPIPIKT